jgi:flagellar hook-associated protein 1 FlgK
MSGTITNGLSALLAAQRALQTTSNNIANSNTDGYVRQRIDFVERPGTPLGRITIGAGVAIGDVSRVYDEFLTENVRTSTSLAQRYTVFGDFATRLDTILGNPDTGVSAAVQRFFDQVEAVGRDPTSIAQRQQLLLEGDSLASRFRQLQTQLDGLGEEIDGRLGNSVGNINQLARQIAGLNQKISQAGSSASADLLDQRDLLLRDLGGQIDITAIPGADGSINVVVGSGQSLVLGGRAAQMSVVPDAYDPSRLQLAIDNGGGTPQVISSRISGGTVGGLLAFRGEVLDTARRDLGQLATGLSELFNAQHRQGMDLNGALGTDFFASSVPRTAGANTNAGSGTLIATITDASALTGRDYELRFGASGWSVVDRATGSAIASAGSGTAADPLRFEGLAVNASAGVVSGDRFVVEPFANALSRFDVQLTDPARIAAAAPLASVGDAANQSQATVSAPSVTDINDPKLRTTATILFDSPSSYVVYTGNASDLVGPLPYVSGQDISFAGWTVQVSGAPQTGDQFFVQAAAAGSGDNSNVLELADTARRGFFNNGTQSLADLGSDLVITVGATANRAANEVKVQSALREQAEIDLSNLSGVNLDEEAANLLRYQEAYLAASKVISVADSLFKDLLSIVGR